jgi:hypothetical protein
VNLFDTQLLKIGTALFLLPAPVLTIVFTPRLKKLLRSIVMFFFMLFLFLCYCEDVKRSIWARSEQSERINYSRQQLFTTENISP